MPAVAACPEPEATVAGRQDFSQRAEVTQITVNAFPNPFRDQLNFRFVSPVSGRATLEVFNMHGQRLGVLFDGNISAGVANFVRYNSANVSGMLIYKLTVGGKVLTGKVQSVK
ncbi:MAG: T9SS type A sorting domain-containing protein [Lacibacter sp.]